MSEVFVTIRDKENTVPKICDKGYTVFNIREELKSIKLTNIMYKDSVVPVKAETFSGMAAKR